VTLLFCGFVGIFGWLVVSATSRRRVVALALVGGIVALLVSAPPVAAQGGLVTAIQGVLKVINGVIHDGLSAINSVRTSINNLYQLTTWPQQLINQTRAQVAQMIGQYRTSMQNIVSTNLSSATLANPIALETLIRDHQTSNFGNLATSYDATFRPVPSAGSTNPMDRAMTDMDDAIALDNLKTLKAGDQAADLTLQAADLLENGASQAAPGSSPFLTASAIVASIQSQALTQKMLAAELRQEATAAAHENSLRKRGAAIATQMRGIITNLLQRR